MKIISGLIILILFISCKHNTGVFLPKSLNKLEIGMEKNDVEFEIQNYRKKSVLDEFYFVVVEGVKTKVSFYFCEQISGIYLEGVVFRTSEYERLYDVLKKKTKN